MKPDINNALTRILSYKTKEVAALKQTSNLDDLYARAKDQPRPRGFIHALNATADGDENALICELKRKSPSGGEISPSSDPIKIAREYAQGGASCLSILTDGPSFGGSLEDMQAVINAVDLPVLRKDFMLDPIQIIEARAYSADAVLLIMAALSDAQASLLEETAAELGMDVLLEVHTAEEMYRALALKSPLIGINNRDLTLMTTDLAVSESLSALIPKGRNFVAESGIKTEQDISRLRQCGARRFLIGEHLMRAQNRRECVKKMRDAK